VSDDLVRWERRGVILDRGAPGAFDSAGAAGLSVLGEGELFADTSHIASAALVALLLRQRPAGYEAGFGSIGLAWTDDFVTWRRHEGIRSSRRGRRAWEKGRSTSRSSSAPPTAASRSSTTPRMS